MKRTTITIASITAALALTACGPTTAGSSSDDEPRGTNTTSSDYTRDAIEDEDEVEDFDVDTADESMPTNAFGETFTYEDGISVHVSEPEAFTPSEWAAGGESHDQHARFTVRVVNKSGAPFDASGAYPSVASGAGEGDEVFDMDSGLAGPPETALLPGRESSWKVGFGVDDPADLVVQVAPSWDHEAAIFTTDGE